MALPFPKIHPSMIGATRKGYKKYFISFIFAFFLLSNKAQAVSEIPKTGSPFVGSVYFLCKYTIWFACFGYTLYLLSKYPDKVSALRQFCGLNLHLHWIAFLVTYIMLKKKQIPPFSKVIASINNRFTRSKQLNKLLFNLFQKIGYLLIVISFCKQMLDLEKIKQKYTEAHLVKDAFPIIPLSILFIELKHFLFLFYFHGGLTNIDPSFL